jgi:hypothetical protein
MDNRTALILAMKHIECSSEDIAMHLIRGDALDLHDINTRLSAAGYLAQLVYSGIKPDNFDEIIAAAEALDPEIDD